MVKNIELKEIKRIGVKSVLKVSALFGLFLGLLLMIYGVILMMVPEVASKLGIDASTITVLSLVGTLIQAVISYSIIGLVLSAIYNLFAKIVGGVKIKLE